MKASYESRRKTFVRLASSFSLTEKWLRKYSESDECNQTDILTSASNLIPAFPIFRPVALGIRSRYSGATVPDLHRIPWHLTAFKANTLFADFKEQTNSMSKRNFGKQIPRQPIQRLNGCD